MSRSQNLYILLKVIFHILYILCSNGFLYYDFDTFDFYECLFGEEEIGFLKVFFFLISFKMSVII